MVGFPVWFKGIKPKEAEKKVEPMGKDDYIVRHRIHNVTEYGYADLLASSDGHTRMVAFTPELRDQFKKIYNDLGDITLCLVYWNAFGIGGPLTRLEPWETALANAYAGYGPLAACTLMPIRSVTQSGLDYELSVDNGTHVISRLPMPCVSARIRAIRALQPDWEPTHAVVSPTGHIQDVI